MAKPRPRFDWRHQYDLDADEREGNAAALNCEDESLTQQSFTQDADLNVIARRFGLNEIPLGTLDASHFRDTTADPDLRDVLEYQRQARDNFMSLPAKLRKRFHNSPNELWQFVNDPENAEEALRLGLLTRMDTAAPAQPGTPTGSASTAPATGATGPTSTEQPPKPPQGDKTP